ncbi:MAG TPA: hypothetical protein VN631_11745 [Negativicutes bacterium]|nr:hypothetical protein [Negativicutes bacterium]
MEFLVEIDEYLLLYLEVFMPTLDWIGKQAVVEHCQNIPFYLLARMPSLDVGEDSGGLLLQGDWTDIVKAHTQK